MQNLTRDSIIQPYWSSGNLTVKKGTLNDLETQKQNNETNLWSQCFCLAVSWMSTLLKPVWVERMIHKTLFVLKLNVQVKPNDGIIKFWHFLATEMVHIICAIRSPVTSVNIRIRTRSKANCFLMFRIPMCHSLFW